MSLTQITLFEHQSLVLDESKGFSQKHLDALENYHDQLLNAKRPLFYDLIHNGVKFSSYVGILQVGNCYIEVLPKLSFDNSIPEEKWRELLCTMLSISKDIRLNPTENSSLNMYKHKLWELFYYAFIDEVEKLIRSGFCKAYQKEESNKNALKGKLFFQKNLNKNLVHKEKFYTGSSEYTQDYLPNQIIRTALEICSTVDCVKTRTKILQEVMQNIVPVSPQAIDWVKVEELKATRKLAAYSQALTLSKLIIDGINPDLNQGRTNVSAIMFDMNELFEEYVARIISRNSADDVSVSAQYQKEIWNGRMCRPDIVWEKGSERIILDTKWKLVSSKSEVASADMYQMFVYLYRFSEFGKQAQKALLIYPCTEDSHEKLLKVDEIQSFEAVPYVNSEKELGLCWFNVFGEY